MVSIIIPIYNAGDKLSVCLESVKKQTYVDIEVIMINDGSSDSSALICKEFSKEDLRFIYIEQINSGVSVARNNGIMHSHGEYICFVDADDSVESDYVQCMVETQQKNNPDLVVQGLTNVYGGKKGDIVEFPKIVLNVNSLNDKIFDKLFYFCGPYCKLFKRENIMNNSIKFPENLSYGEDFVFYTTYLHLCKNIAFLSNTSYNYSVGVKGSLSSKRLHPDKFWENQVNRRREYLALRNQYHIEKKFYLSENVNKLIAIRGLLSCVKYYGLDFKVYLDKIRYDVDFGFLNICPRTFFDNLLLFLIKRNTLVSRFILKMIIK